MLLVSSHPAKRVASIKKNAQHLSNAKVGIKTPEPQLPYDDEECLVLLALGVQDGSINSLLKIKVEEWPVETLDGDKTTALRVSRLLLGRPGDVEGVGRLNVLAERLSVQLLVDGDGSGGAVITAKLGNTEDGLVRSGTVLIDSGSVAEAGSSKSTLSPAVVDVGKVPVDDLGSGELVKLVANVDETLNGGDINIVDTGEVEYDGLEDGSGVIDDLLDVAGLAVVPGTILFHHVSSLSSRLGAKCTYTKLAKKSGVGSSTLLEDGLGEVVEISRGVGIVETLSEAVDKDTGVRMTDNDLGVGAVTVVKRKEASAAGGVGGIVERNLLSDGSRGRSTVVNVGPHGAHADGTEEAALSLEEAVNDNGEGDRDSGVDTVLDAAEDGDKDTGEEDDNIKRRDPPELVNDARGSDDISNGVDNDCGETCVGNVEKDGG